MQTKLDEASNQFEVGGRYQHYKGAEYTYIIKDLVIIEENDEVAVVYEPEYFPKETSVRFIRPLSVWLEKVEWNGETVERFKLVK